MKCLAGVEYPSGQPCPECGAKLGDVCWPGINKDLLELNELRKLAKGAVEEYPVASGLYVDTDGKDGYGNLRALRLLLEGREEGSEQSPRLSDIAEVIHNARFGPGYPPHLVNSFDREGLSGQEYCYRLARAMLTHFKVAARQGPDMTKDRKSKA